MPLRFAASRWSRRLVLCAPLLALYASAAAQQAPRVLTRTALALPDTSTVEGEVVVRVFLDSAGAVVRAVAETTLRPDADSLAVATVRSWTFSAARTATGEGQAASLRVRLAFRPNRPLPSPPPVPEWALSLSPIPHLVFGGRPIWVSSTTPEAWTSTGAACTEARAPVRLSGSDPQYPDPLRRRGQEGRVVFAMAIGADGRVTDLRVAAADDQAFIQASRTALRTWRFTPATCDGVPTSSAMLLPVRFRTGTLGYVYQ